MSRSLRKLVSVLGKTVTPSSGGFRRNACGAEGFTLIEVMIALAILAMSLTMLLRGSAANVAASQRAQMMSVATELARAKMYDLEEELLERGFQQLNKTEKGDFKEEGWARITWEAEITKIELPNMTAMQTLGADGSEEEQGGGPSSGGGVMGGMLGGMGGSDGGAGAGLIGSQFELFRNILEESIRKVHLTVGYRVAGHDEEFSVDCYFTEPHAVNRVINLGPGAGYEDSADDPAKTGAKSGATAGGVK